MNPNSKFPPKYQDSQILITGDLVEEIIKHGLLATGTLKKVNLEGCEISIYRTNKHTIGIKISINQAKDNEPQ